jgi:hypothetical protein
MKPNFSKIRVISFTRKTNVSNYQYRLGNSFILPTDCIKDLGVHIDCKLHFHHDVDFLFSHTMKLLGLIRTLTFSFSTTDSLLILFFALVRSKLEYASVSWNSVTTTDSNKLEGVQRKFAALCHKRFLQDMEYHYDNILEKVNLPTLHMRRRHIDALFIINAFCAPLSWKQSVFVFQHGTYVISPHSVAPSATALQHAVYLLQMQSLNL